MKVLIIGSGGREHALAWKVAQNPQVEQLFVAPGNGGTANLNKCQNMAVAAEDIDGLLQLAQAQSIDLTIVGPEAALVDGIVDRFQKNGLRCFGPNAAAAQMEGSKAYAKDFMRRHAIPTAAYAEFSDLQTALDYLSQRNFPQVIKASGLAAGKGVIIAEDLSAATAAVHDMLSDKQFGSAGESIVIEDFLVGEEASFIIVADGTDYIEFATSQDHKRAFDNDEGPNTGGMGAYSPAPVVTPEVREHIIQSIIEPTLKGLKNDGIHYTGFLYAGVMIDANGVPRVLEFNCRLGDPETQPLMMRLNSDLIEIVDAALDHKLNQITVDWSKQSTIGVVMATTGYPGSYPKGMPITGQLDATNESLVFHAGTTIKDQELQTSGGRVLCVTAQGDSLQQARDNAYKHLSEISFEEAFYRRDIGYRAL